MVFLIMKEEDEKDERKVGSLFLLTKGEMRIAESKTEGVGAMRKR